MARGILIILSLLSSLLINAQIIVPDDPSLSRNFRAEIKSLDEFCSRFNGLESHPEVKDDPRTEILNITRLFDFQKVIHSKDKGKVTTEVEAFCDSVLKYNITLSMDDPDMFALADCNVKFEGKIRNIRLLLKQQVTDNGYTRWSIAAVKGLINEGIVKTVGVEKISPVEHEVHFMGMDDILNNNRSLAFGYRAAEMEINQLSVFLALIQTGALEFINVKDVEIYCFKVPGFVFVISEIVRDSTNSGWLISELIHCSFKEKSDLLLKLYTEE